MREKWLTTWHEPGEREEVERDSSSEEVHVDSTCTLRPELVGWVVLSDSGDVSVDGEHRPLSRDTVHTLHSHHLQ